MGNNLKERLTYLNRLMMIIRSKLKAKMRKNKKCVSQYFFFKKFLRKRMKIKGK
jgi:hypothetical protein